MDAKITNQALAVIAHELITLELMLADSMEGKLNLRCSEKTMAMDQQMVDALCELMKTDMENTDVDD